VKDVEIERKRVEAREGMVGAVVEWLVETFLKADSK
jgi:hypothetical protein